jgi:hypothetical protein
LAEKHLTAAITIVFNAGKQSSAISCIRKAGSIVVERRSRAAFTTIRNGREVLFTTSNCRKTSFAVAVCQNSDATCMAAGVKLVLRRVEGDECAGSGCSNVRQEAIGGSNLHAIDGLQRHERIARCEECSVAYRGINDAILFVPISQGKAASPIRKMAYRARAFVWPMTLFRKTSRFPASAKDTWQPARAYPRAFCKSFSRETEPLSLSV